MASATSSAGIWDIWDVCRAGNAEALRRLCTEGADVNLAEFSGSGSLALVAMANGLRLARSWQWLAGRWPHAAALTVPGSLAGLAWSDGPRLARSGSALVCGREPRGFSNVTCKYAYGGSKWTVRYTSFKFSASTHFTVICDAAYDPYDHDENVQSLINTMNPKEATEQERKRNNK